MCCRPLASENPAAMYAVVLGTPAFLHLAVCQNDGPSRNDFQSSSVTLDTSKKPWFWDILSILVYSTPLSGHMFQIYSNFRLSNMSWLRSSWSDHKHERYIMTHDTNDTPQTDAHFVLVPNTLVHTPEHPRTHALLDHRNQWRLLQFPLATLQSLATICYNIQRCALAAPCPNDPTGQSFLWSPDAGQHTSSKESKLIPEIVGRNTWNNM